MALKQLRIKPREWLGGFSHYNLHPYFLDNWDLLMASIASLEQQDRDELKAYFDSAVAEEELGKSMMEGDWFEFQDKYCGLAEYEQEKFYKAVKEAEIFDFS